MELTVALVASIAFTLYLVIIGYFYHGWHKEKPYILNSIPAIPLSIIIPFRNEEKALPAIFEALNQQTIPPGLFEVLFIDDHSTDESVSILHKLTSGKTNYFLHSSQEEGKKKAVKYGINHCKYNYIITIDADCIPTKQWLEYISGYLQEKKPDMIIGGVFFHEKNSWFTSFQFYEFISLIISGAGAALKKMPIMCNAANLIFTKELYNNAQPYIINKYASGDDIFLLHYAKKHHYKIDFLKTKNCVVYTTPPKSIHTFYQQRIRWASKSKGYSDIFTIIVAMVVFITCLIEILLPLFLNYYPQTAILLLFFITIKIILDYKVIQSGSKFLNQKLKIRHYLSFAIVYPFYIVSTALLSFISKTKWKNRKV